MDCPELQWKSDCNRNEFVNINKLDEMKEDETRLG